MRRFFLIPVLFALAATLGISTGCKTGPSEKELALTAMHDQLSAVQQGYADLQQKRQELATTQATISEIEAIKERKRSDEQKTQLEEAQGKLQELQKSIDEGYNGVQDTLASLLNTMLNDYPDAPETLDALKIYSDEAIGVAEDLIAKSGNYNKAIKQLASAEGYYQAIQQPPYQALEDKIAEYQDWRFITKERFDQVKKHMTEDEVKALVGVPYTHNIQTDPKKGVTAWMYKKREGGGAGIYFKTKNNKVYSMNWNALKTKVVK